MDKYRVLRKISTRIVAVASVFALAVASAWAGEKPPTPDEALALLKEGNARFAAGKSTHPRIGPDQRALTVADGQHPMVSVIGCSDSRAPVETIFDQGIGDVFVIRVAGNVANVDEIATVEYGVGHLHTPLVVVLGHTQCGAVTAVVMKEEVHGFIPKLVAGIVPVAERAAREYPKLTGKELVPATIKANVFQAMSDLLSRSGEIRDLAKENKIKVVGAIYELSSGKVQWLGPHPEEAQLLSAAGGGTEGTGGHGAQ